MPKWCLVDLVFVVLEVQVVFFVTENDDNNMQARAQTLIKWKKRAFFYSST